MNILSPSILAADFNRLGEDIKAVELAGAQMLHIDVMDGLFVPSISFGMPVIASIRKNTKMFFDVHLMINEPIRYINEFKAAGADGLTVHVEACKDVAVTLEAIREKGMKVGLSLNPETDVKEIIPYLDKLDLVLVMTVHPGFGGQKLIPECFEKVKVIREELKRMNSSCLLQVDGGINKENILSAIQAGADTIVAGSAVFNGNALENAKDFLEIMK